MSTIICLSSQAFPFLLISKVTSALQLGPCLSYSPPSRFLSFKQIENVGKRLSCCLLSGGWDDVSNGKLSSGYHLFIISLLYITENVPVWKYEQKTHFGCWITWKLLKLKAPESDREAPYYQNNMLIFQSCSLCGSFETPVEIRFVLLQF